VSWLRVIRVNLESPPLASTMREDGTIPGYEPAAIQLVAERMGREVEWVFRPWASMVPTLLAGGGDVVWCGQGVTEGRSRLVDFTHPYAIFDETVLVRAGAGIRAPEELAGLRVAAIANSTNMALAETFEGAELVAFDGSGDDVFGDMLAALRASEVDAVVDDDVVTVPLDSDPDFEVAFTVETGNRWAVGVAKDRPDVRDAVDAAIRDVIADGSLAEVWAAWLTDLPFPDRLTHGL
jgi:polar amino acid transport system substrate-binding protein